MILLILKINSEHLIRKLNAHQPGIYHLKLQFPLISKPYSSVIGFNHVTICSANYILLLDNVCVNTVYH
jgi:hypothetical protein